MVFRLDLQGGMSDAVLIGQQLTGLIEHRMRVGADRNHQVSSGDLHLRRQRPHVQIVNVDNTADASQLGLQLSEIKARRRVGVSSTMGPGVKVDPNRLRPDTEVAAS